MAANTAACLLLLLLPLLLMAGSSCACNLTQRIYREDGTLHRCVNSSGTNRWSRNAACWVASATGRQELEFGERSLDASGRAVAECRRRSGTVALVQLACAGANGDRRWPGDVWTEADGRRRICVEACDNSHYRYFRNGAAALVFGCDNSTVEPNSTRLLPNGLVQVCEYSGCQTRRQRYDWLSPIGCWLRHRQTVVRLGVGENFENNDTLAASCRQRFYHVALVWHVCRHNLSASGRWQAVGSDWRDAKGWRRECVAADASEFGQSAVAALRGCLSGTNGSLLAPGADRLFADGSVVRCSFNKYRRRYGWYDTVGCWQSDRLWRRLTSSRILRLPVGEELSINGSVVARCVKMRYRQQVAVVRAACFEKVGPEVAFRRPNENWTDADGVGRMCVPMAEQRYHFGVGAKTVVRGCSVANGSSLAAPGAVQFDDDLFVRRCMLNERKREFNFDRVVGCWMRKPGSSSVVRIGVRESYSLPDGRRVASCQKKSRYSDVKFVAEVCFKSNASTPLSWSRDSIAFPGDVVETPAGKMQCNEAAKYSRKGEWARWIVFGCPGNGSATAPGTERLEAGGVVRRCAHNELDGGRAAYSWAKAVGCWFVDHKNQTQKVMRFNSNFQHPQLKRPVAVCSRSSRYADPELKLLVCFSPANGEVYDKGDRWEDASTRWDKECVAASRYPGSRGVLAIDGGCWLTVARGNGTQRQLFANGTRAFGDKNRVLRCDFNERSRRYEWLTSVACWTVANGSKNSLPVGQEVWQDGQLVAKCHNSRKGALFLRHSCRHSGAWRPALSSWQDARFRYTCEQASVSSGRHAKVERTHCVTDDGQTIDSSQKINGVQYLCMHICGFLVFFREPTPQQYRFVSSFINNCHAASMSIISNIG